MALDLLSLPGSLSQDTLLVIGAYGALAGLYLLVVPLALFLWMNKRWHQMGKIERLVVYGMVFSLLPGNDCLCSIPQSAHERTGRGLR